MAHDGKFRRERNSADRFGIASDRVRPPRLAASFMSGLVIGIDLEGRVAALKRQIVGILASLSGSASLVLI